MIVLVRSEVVVDWFLSYGFWLWLGFILAVVVMLMHMVQIAQALSIMAACNYITPSREFVMKNNRSIKLTIIITKLKEINSIIALS